MKEIKLTFPSCYYYPRRDYTLQEIAKYAVQRQYTNLMVWRATKTEI